MKPSELTGYDNFKDKVKLKYLKEKMERRESHRTLRDKKSINPITQIWIWRNHQYSLMMKRQFKKRIVIEYCRVQKGAKWWARVNRYFFRKFEDDYLDCIIEYSTSHDITELGGQISPLSPFYESVLCKSAP